MWEVLLTAEAVVPWSSAACSPVKTKTKAVTRVPGCYCWHATNKLRDIVGKISRKLHLFLLILSQKSFVRVGLAVKFLSLFWVDENIQPYGYLLQNQNLLVRL